MMQRRTTWLGFFLLAAMAGCEDPSNSEDFFTVLLKGPKVKIENPSFIELSFQGAIQDGPSSNPFIELSSKSPASIWDIRKALKIAASDARILGIKIEIDSAEIGLGFLEELANILDEFRESGKPVYAYLRGDAVSDGDYLLALCADKIFVHSASALMVNGLRAEVTFWRGALDKLGIVPHVLMFKEYKSAGEPYSRSSMSEAFRESLTAVLSDMEERIVARISSRRSLPPIQVKSGMSMGLMTTQEALQTGWIDDTGSRIDIENALLDAVDAEAYEGLGVKRYLRALDDGKNNPSSAFLANLAGNQKPVVALIFAHGPIIAQEKTEDPFEAFSGAEGMIYGLELARTVDAAALDDDVQSIVLRIDSPGGSAVGSDHVHQAILRAKARGKKIVVSMASVAASGGYWISMGADKIVAQPTTITGSIGVVAMQFDVRGFYEWIGANIETVSFSKGSGIASSVEDFDELRKGRWMAWMTAVYEDFKANVSIGRGLTMEQVEEIARGRIWSGQDALENKLVDRLGGLEVALQESVALAGLESLDAVDIQIYPKKNPLEELFGGLFAQTAIQNSDPQAILQVLDRRTLKLLERPRVLVTIPNLWIE